jgi:hypothetical protein
MTDLQYTVLVFLIAGYGVLNMIFTAIWARRILKQIAERR